MNGPAPLAAYDARDGSYEYGHHEPFREWCAEQGIDIMPTVRIEIHLIDTLFARITEHVRDPETGKVMVDVERDEIRTRVHDVLVTSRPPQAPLPARTPR